MRMRPVILAAVGGLTLVGASSPARADWEDHDGWRRQEWREQAWREHQWREQRWREHEWRQRAYEPPPIYARPPAYYYAPPPAYYYAPPPQRYYGQGGYAGFGFYFR